MIQPLFGACSSGWFKKNAKRPPGSSTRAISAIAGSCAAMCSKTKHTTTASNAADGNGKASAFARAYPIGPPRSRAARSCASVGSTPTTSEAPSRASESSDLSLPGTDVEHPPRTRETLTRQRKDLLLVLRVGAVGEALLPPTRIAFPQARVVACVGGVVVAHSPRISVRCRAAARGNGRCGSREPSRRSRERLRR